MKRISILGLITAMAMALASCGGTPAIGNLRTITLLATPSTNLVGEGGTVQLSATGTYTTGDTHDITRRVTFAAVPVGTDDNGVALAATPSTVSINTTGLVTAVAPFVCSWIDLNPAASTPAWAISGSYQVTATYSGITSQPVFITVASAASSTNPTGQCGP